jgi:plasmid maintenance system antidote protein VapI
MSNQVLFDTLRKEFNIASDSALADELDIAPSQISRMRGGKRLTAGVILAIHEYLGLPVVEIRELAARDAPPHQ